VFLSSFIFVFILLFLDGFGFPFDAFEFILLTDNARSDRAVGRRVEILRFPLPLQCAFCLETFEDIDNIATSHQFRDGGADSRRVTWHHREIFSGFIVIPFIVGFLKTVYAGSRADLTIHISGKWLVAWHIEETMRTPGLVLFCRRGLETELGDMLLDQVGKKQMRQQR